MTFAASLRLATEAANLRIHQFATDHPEHRGMGTTATVAGLLGDTLYLTQVGDSRAYLIRAGEARQITKDQSLMQRLIEAGEITAEEAEHSDRRNIILQALGPEARISIDLTHQRIRRGDTLILCSDGLSGQVRTEEIARIATEERDLMAICRQLIDRANETGGPDNITVVAARFEGETLIAAEAGEEVGHRVYPLGDETTPSIPAPKFIRRRSGTPPMVGGVDGTSDPSATPAIADDQLLATRRQRGRPLVIMLAVLALIAGAVAVWYIADLVATRSSSRGAAPTADSTAAGARTDSLTPPL
jgi:serine/threonine protein phosphatase PrpC